MMKIDIKKNKSHVHLWVRSKIKGKMKTLFTINIFSDKLENEEDIKKLRELLEKKLG